jgi:hypothetical protein
VGERNELRARVEQLLVLVERELARVVDRHYAELRALLLAQHLPRHDVRVVLQVGEDDLVAGADERAPVTLHHEVDAVGHVRREDHLALLARVEEALHLPPRLLVGLGRLLRQVVDAAVDVRVLPGAVVHHPIDDGLRHLARGRVVEEDERLPVGPDVRQDREVRAEALKLGRARRRRAQCGRGHAVSPPCVSCSTVRRNDSTIDGTGIRSTISAAKP